MVPVEVILLFTSILLFSALFFVRRVLLCCDKTTTCSEHYLEARLLVVSTGCDVDAEGFVRLGTFCELSAETESGRIG